MSTIGQIECVSSNSQDLLCGIFSAYSALRRSKCQQQACFVSGLSNRWLSVKNNLNAENKKFSQYFHPFDHIPIVETTHSRVLGELLNPCGNHGQGSLFLTSFLELLEIPNPTKGQWRVAVERGHVDILLCRNDPASVIIIENKSNDAVDQGNQLYRYWHQQIHKRYPTLNYSKPETNASFKVIYLPPNSSKKPDENSLTRPPQWENTSDLRMYPRMPLAVVDTLCFSPHVAEWIIRMSTKLDDGNVRLRTFLQFYAEIWR